MRTRSQQVSAHSAEDNVIAKDPPSPPQPMPVRHKSALRSVSARAPKARLKAPSHSKSAPPTKTAATTSKTPATASKSATTASKSAATASKSATTASKSAATASKSAPLLKSATTDSKPARITVTPARSAKSGKTLVTPSTARPKLKSNKRRSNSPPRQPSEPIVVQSDEDVEELQQMQDTDPIASPKRKKSKVMIEPLARVLFVYKTNLLHKGKSEPIWSDTIHCDADSEAFNKAVSASEHAVRVYAAKMKMTGYELQKRHVDIVATTSKSSERFPKDCLLQQSYDDGVWPLLQLLHLQGKKSLKGEVIETWSTLSLEPLSAPTPTPTPMPTPTPTSNVEVATPRAHFRYSNQRNNAEFADGLGIMNKVRERWICEDAYCRQKGAGSVGCFRWGPQKRTHLPITGSIVGEWRKGIELGQCSVEAPSLDVLQLLITNQEAVSGKRAGKQQHQSTDPTPLPQAYPYYPPPPYPHTPAYPLPFYPPQPHQNAATTVATTTAAATTSSTIARSSPIPQEDDEQQELRDYCRWLRYRFKRLKAEIREAENALESGYWTLSMLQNTRRNTDLKADLERSIDVVGIRYKIVDNVKEFLRWRSTKQMHELSDSDLSADLNCLD